MFTFLNNTDIPVFYTYNRRALGTSAHFSKKNEILHNIYSFYLNSFVSKIAISKNHMS